MGNYPIESFVSDAPRYNLHYAAFATSIKPGTGTVGFNTQDNKFAEKIAANKASGSYWMISVGGAIDGGIHLTNSDQVNEMVSSLTPIIEKYGFQGVDWDLEDPNSSYENGAIVAASQKLKEKFGNDFTIQFTLGAWGTERRDMVAANPKAFDLLGYMFYCEDVYTDRVAARQRITQIVNEAVLAGVPASKILVGAMMGSNDTHAEPEVYFDTYKELKNKHQDLRGLFHWETTIDRDAGWLFAKNAAK